MDHRRTKVLIAILAMLIAQNVCQPIEEGEVESLIRTKRAIPLFVAWIATAVAGAAVGSTFNDVLRFNNEILGNECGVIIKWAGQNSLPGVNMNFKAKFEDNWNHEILNLGFWDVTPGYYVDKTRERVDGGKLEFILFWWDKVSITIRGHSKNKY